MRSQLLFWRLWAVTFALLALAACDPSGGGGNGQPDLPDPDVTPAAYCAVAPLERLVSWSGDYATLCDSPNGPLGEGPPSGCEHYHVERDGSLRALPLPNMGILLHLSDGTLVASREDGALVRLGPAGENEVLAEWATDASAARDVPVVAYITTEPASILMDETGLRYADAGAPLRVALFDLRTGAERIVAEDELASKPYPTPDGRAAIYVSGRSGVASIYRGTATGEPRQLTNVGLVEAGQGFVPVFSRELIWLPQGERAVYTATYESDRLWLLDASTGDAEELGPGRTPRIAPDGAVLGAREGGSSSDCAYRYLGGGAP